MKLQLALDVLKIEDALNIAGKVKSADLLEAGTPLIKSEGMKAVSFLKDNFPEKTVVADMKTMDTGYLEAEMAFEAGADIISVLGVSSDATIKGALAAAEDFGKNVMIDLIEVANKVERAMMLDSFGAAHILVHTGIDEQKGGKNPVADIKKLAGKLKTPLAVAGGITDKTAPLLKNIADIFVVGSFITKAENPEYAARKIKNSLK